MHTRIPVTLPSTSTQRSVQPCPPATSHPRCSVHTAAMPSGQPVAQTSEAQALNRRQLLALPALVPMLSALAAAPAPANAAANSLPPTAVPGTSLIPDGEVTLIGSSDVVGLTPSEKQVYQLNRRIQTQNRIPEGFPGFVRTGFDVKVVGDNFKQTNTGLLYQDFTEGKGSTPVDGNEVVFHYTGYNESGTLIDSSYRQGRPAQIRLGVAGMIPGFEEGIRSMRVGQQRRIIVPPALGPPVGPSTFFSAKQCEVFDIELLSIRICERRQMAMFSDVVCT